MYPLLRVIKTLLGGGAEIHINDLQSNGSSSGSSSKYAPRYYSIDWDKASDGWKKILTCSDTNTLGLHLVSTTKIYTNTSSFIINAYGTDVSGYDDIIAFSYLPVYVSTKLIEEVLGIKTDISLYEELNDLLLVVNSLMSMLGYTNISMEGITEITEEEYYKID